MSGIIRAAYQINRGQYPSIEPISDAPQSDCLWHGGAFEPEHQVQAICELIQDFIPSVGSNPITDIQVLCARDVMGTRNLNQVLQQLLNPPTPEKAQINRGGDLLRVGNRVIQLKNDYEREVFNGDLGIVNAIDSTEHEVTIQFEGRAVR